jgi:hypothetical protein
MVVGGDQDRAGLSLADDDMQVHVGEIRRLISLLAIWCSMNIYPEKGNMNAGLLGQANVSKAC